MCAIDSIANANFTPVLFELVRENRSVQFGKFQNLLRLKNNFYFAYSVFWHSSSSFQIVMNGEIVCNETIIILFAATAMHSGIQSSVVM